MDVRGADYGEGAEFIVWPDNPVHQLLAVEEPAVVLEAHWPPLYHSIIYRSPKRDTYGVLVVDGEWFSKAERRRRFREEE